MRLSSRLIRFDTFDFSGPLAVPSREDRANHVDRIQRGVAFRVDAMAHPRYLCVRRPLNIHGARARVSKIYCVAHKRSVPLAVSLSRSPSHALEDLGQSGITSITRVAFARACACTRAVTAVSK